MCGFIFQYNKHNPINALLFKSNLSKMQWRGPDAQDIVSLQDGKVALGHCRLSIIDLSQKANQPMYSASGRYVIILNGEIYNHQDIRRELNLNCITTSDTETIVEGYEIVGNKIFEMLDGMFSLVIYDTKINQWVASRDAFGIKPMYIYEDSSTTIISSEPAIIASMVDAKPDLTSLDEWEIVRRPLPGKSFFENINEVLPGSIIDSKGNTSKHWQWTKSNEAFEQDKFESLLYESIKKHELSDVKIVSLLSGGLDSAIIATVSDVQRCYTVGLEHNNEFEGASDTAKTINRELIKVTTDEQELKDTWRYLTKLRGEPLSLPNEGLIYLVCKSMQPDEKVVMTGEGADELLFGYDGIFRWANNLKDGEIDPEEFLIKYGYSDTVRSSRLLDYVKELAENKTPIEFVEDFFYQLHLPGLLRRMDFASMAASKEARVPFISKELISYLYRQPSKFKINEQYGKIPIRNYAERLKLEGALNRKKIGFSAQVNKENSRINDYAEFRKLILEVLKW